MSVKDLLSRGLKSRSDPFEVAIDSRLSRRCLLRRGGNYPDRPRGQYLSTRFLRKLSPSTQAIDHKHPRPPQQATDRNPIPTIRAQTANKTATWTPRSRQNYRLQQKPSMSKIFYCSSQRGADGTSISSEIEWLTRERLAGRLGAIERTGTQPPIARRACRMATQLSEHAAKGSANQTP